MFALLRNLMVLLVLAVVSRVAFALPQVSQAAATSTVAAAAAATTQQAAPATVYTYTTIVDGVTYTNVDTFTPTYEPTIMPTLTFQGTVMPYSEFSSVYLTATSSASSVYSLPPGILWAGVTTLLGFALGVRAVGLL